ncbi:helix-turn-helix domain-containing protein [Pediococcus pentosaceus]|uniref:helix-turn-helix domain-containing protein n=1 Tax=Pediococcus pentosaceus TaxID=1255 RepID=UPI001F176BE9|nr:helix-turn-helix domain-containing protein [Pediococcus pentosaceus]WRI50248.1 helix-turn-helix domain-containing protein [Pediococcus pentosaceus]
METLTEEATLENQALELQLKIEIARKRKGMTQEQLTAAIGEKWPSVVSRAIRGDQSPKSKRVREKIYRVLDL